MVWGKLSHVWGDTVTCSSFASGPVCSGVAALVSRHLYVPVKSYEVNGYKMLLSNARRRGSLDPDEGREGGKNVMMVGCARLVSNLKSRALYV